MPAAGVVTQEVNRLSQPFKNSICLPLRCAFHGMPERYRWPPTRRSSSCSWGADSTRGRFSEAPGRSRFSRNNGPRDRSRETSASSRPSPSFCALLRRFFWPSVSSDTQCITNRAFRFPALPGPLPRLNITAALANHRTKKRRRHCADPR